MKTAVIGSRSLYINIDKYLSEVEERLNAKITMVISGGARGIDISAEEYADRRGIPKKIFLPDYLKHGKSAPLIRNVSIVRNADIIVAFWDRISRGTKFVIDYAKVNGKKLIVYNFCRL